MGYTCTTVGCDSNMTQIIANRTLTSLPLNITNLFAGNRSEISCPPPTPPPLPANPTTSVDLAAYDVNEIGVLTTTFSVLSNQIEDDLELSGIQILIEVSTLLSVIF